MSTAFDVTLRPEDNCPVIVGYAMWQGDHEYTLYGIRWVPQNPGSSTLVDTLLEPVTFDPDPSNPWPPSAFYKLAFPFWISRDGNTVVGTVQYSVNNRPWLEKQQRKAFKWTSASNQLNPIAGTVDLGAYNSSENCSYNSLAYAATLSANLIVGYGTYYNRKWEEYGKICVADNDQKSTRAIRAENNDINQIDMGDYYSEAVAVSENGALIAINRYAGTPNPIPTAFVKTSSGLTQLVYLEEGGTLSAAEAVSKHGTIIVGYSNLDENKNKTRAVRWTPQGNIVSDSLSHLPDGLGGNDPCWNYSGQSLCPSSQAYDVTDDGQTVVGTVYLQMNSNNPCPEGPINMQGVAFIWKPSFENGPMKLSDYLVQKGFNQNEVEDWHFCMANAISRDGRAVVGYGVRQSEPSVAEAFVALIDPVPQAVPFNQQQVLR